MWRATGKSDITAIEIKFDICHYFTGNDKKFQTTQYFRKILIKINCDKSSYLETKLGKKHCLSKFLK